MGSMLVYRQARDVIESSHIRDSFRSQQIHFDPFPRARTWFEVFGNPLLLYVSSVAQTRFGRLEAFSIGSIFYVSPHVGPLPREVIP
jgi:hypothetical protein